MSNVLRGIITCCGVLAILVMAMVTPVQSARAQPPARWTLSRDFVLGHNDPEIEAAFTKVKEVVVAPNGNVFVADARARQVRLFDAEGRHKRLVMRQGRGPGEIGNLGAMGVLADTVWADDLNLRRVTLLTQNGEVARTISYDPNASRSPGEPASMEIAGIIPNGEAIALGETRQLIFESYERGIPQLLLRATRTARSLDTIGSVSVKNSIAIHRDGPTMRMLIQRFSDAPIVQVEGNAGRAYIIDRTVAANSRNAEIVVAAIKHTGDTLWARRLRYEPRRLEKAAADSFRKEVERAYSSTSVKASERARIAFIPTYRPPVSQAFVASDGKLWLRREEGRPEVEYWILDRQGTLTGALVVPRQIVLLEATATHAWGSETDEDDVPRVVRFSIQK